MESHLSNSMVLLCALLLHENMVTKNPKSIIRIEFLEEQPLIFWVRSPYQREYGCLSNVNPNVPHPRWSQEFDRTQGKGERSRSGTERPTPIFNCYEKFVGKMYTNEPKTP